jgi:hypothetical protein
VAWFGCLSTLPQLLQQGPLRSTGEMLLDHRSQTRTSANFATALTLPPPPPPPLPPPLSNSYSATRRKLVRLIRVSTRGVSVRGIVKSK